MDAFRAARVLTDDGEKAGWWVTVDDGLIVEVGPEPPSAAGRIDLGDCDLIPGLVDVHSDCLEEIASPRPTTRLPLDAALVQLDTEAAAWGITTHFLCISLDDSTGVRTPERSFETLAVLAGLDRSTRARHLLHLRVELTGFAHEVVAMLAADPLVRIVSYMDHTPGRGQYADEADWRAYYARNPNLTAEALDAVLEQRYAASGSLGEQRRAVAELARTNGATLASHDDDGAEAIADAIELGVAISEFPVSHEAAAHAAAQGLGVVMGAPNALRGRSHLGNLSARDAVRDGCVHALASDYHPPSLLRAVYAIADDDVCSWADAVRLATSAPAAMVGLDDCGALVPGRRADLVAVDRRCGMPTVVQTWSAGRPAFGGVRPAAVPA